MGRLLLALGFALSLTLGALVPGLARAQGAAAEAARQTAAVEDLRALREIKRLQAELGYRQMAGDWQGVAALFAEDAVLTADGQEARGREAIAGRFRASGGHGGDGMPAGRLNLHVWLSPVVTLAPDGRSATGRWHEIALIGEAGVSAEWLGATHIVEYTRSGEGWQIAASRAYRHFAGPYAQGWSHAAETLERAPYHYTPDAAGQVLSGRSAAQAARPEAIAREATLLLRHGTAQNLVNAYGYYLDRGLYDDIVDLFAPEAQIDVAGQGVYNGHASVRRYLGRYGAPGLDEGELNDRPQLMPLVSVSDDGTTALVRVTEIGMTGQHGAAGYWSASINTFQLRADEGGRWRIVQLHVRPLMRADYREGWARPLPAALPIGEDLWPDGPPQPGNLAYPEHAFALQPLPPGIVFPAREPAGPMAITAGALAMAEAFDGAENVSNAYGYYIDQFAWRDTAALFATDGWKELSYIGTFVGREEVLQSLITRYGEGGPNDAFQAIHQKTQPFITVLDDGTAAHVRTRLMQFNSSSTGPGSWIGGIYENQVVKEAGVWRIHGMDLDYVWLGDYPTGWTGIDPAASSRFAPPPEQLAQFEIDAPLRGETFAPFPRIAPMGFHFDNPVSGRAPAVKLQWSSGYAAGK